MRKFLDVVSTIVVTGAAVTMLGLYIHDRSASATAGEAYLEDWRNWESAARFGADDAGIVVDVFMDFTCPYCERLAPVLDSLLATHPRDFAIRFHHFPLHDSGASLESAMAADCALRQDRFDQMYRALYAQRSLGVRPWRSFAEDAGVPDLRRFDRCLKLPPDAFDRIASGRQLGERIGVGGTPSIVVNGWLYPRGRSVAAFLEKAEELGLELGS